MEVHLVAMTAIDWEKYVKRVEALTGKSPTRKLDELNIPVGNHESYVLSLTSFFQNPNPLSCLQRQPKLYRHVNMTFVCQISSDVFQKLVVANNMTFIECGDDTYVITVNVASLSETIISCMTTHYSFEMREFLTSIIYILDRLQFTLLFSNYKRIRISDGSMILERRGNGADSC
jgi:hypothetical protein